MRHETTAIAIANLGARDLLASEHDEVVATIRLRELLQQADLVLRMTLYPGRYHRPKRMPAVTNDDSDFHVVQFGSIMPATRGAPCPSTSAMALADICRSRTGSAISPC